MKTELVRPVLANKENLAEKTREIIQAVRTGGDATVLDFTAQFDGVKLSQVQVSSDEFTQAYVSDDVKNAIIFAKTQLEKNQSAQLVSAKKVEVCEGVYCEKQWRPIERVGLYVPGGTAPLVSTVLMLAVPAKIAGNPLRVLCTPPDKNGEINPAILFAARLCGIDNVYKVGGAQAIAAMAYGTESVPKVDKIYGPGNRWVTQAKQIVSNDPEGAAIDIPAGPSEVLVIADESANPDFVAADLLSQAEHDVDSQVILLALSENFISRVKAALDRQVTNLSRKDIILRSLINSRMRVVRTIEDAIVISNRYAPEHLILQLENPENYMAQINNAGTVFLGAWAPETVGDYVTGSSHVLPTYGYARMYSGSSVLDFMKSISFQTVTKTGLKNIGPYAEQLANLEGLDAHKNAVSLRLKELNNE